MTRRLLSRAAVLAAALALAPGAGCAQAPAGRRPTLVVLFTVDQMRPDYFDRWAGQLTGGLARLRRGAYFTGAYQDHAITETAPGHASTLSGRFPVHTGIISNSVGVVDRAATLLTGMRGEAGASPLRFQGTTLTDWLTAKDPKTHVVSVSTKDRAA